MESKWVTNREKIQSTVSSLMKKGCTKDAAFSLLLSNLDLLKLTENELAKKISIIYNHDDIYAALYCNQNDYRWALYKDGNFSEFIKYDPKKNDYDYIVELVLSFTENPKFKKIFDFKNQNSLEEKINLLKNVKTNEQGYHIN